MESKPIGADREDGLSAMRGAADEKTERAQVSAGNEIMLRTTVRLVNLFAHDNSLKLASMSASYRPRSSSAVACAATTIRIKGDPRRLHDRATGARRARWKPSVGGPSLMSTAALTRALALAGR